jgi:hypothetical protein
MDVTPRGDVSPRVAQVITDDVLSEVRRRNPDVSVIGAEEVRALLGAQAERQRLGCQQGKDDVACMAEIGGALGAQRLVLGTVGQLGDTYLLTVKLVDVRHAKVLNEASARVQTQKQGELIEVASRLVGHLFPSSSITEAPPPVAVETTASTESHAIAIGFGAGAGVCAAGTVFTW